jgi:APA family basic amino acid/polyamine antiporter
MDCVFFGLTATCLFVFRARDARATADGGGMVMKASDYRVPGHPWTTGLFIPVCWLVVGSSFYKYPTNSLIGAAIVVAGIPVYFIWGTRRARTRNST